MNPSLRVGARMSWLAHFGKLKRLTVAFQHGISKQRVFLAPQPGVVCHHGNGIFARQL